MKLKNDSIIERMIYAEIPPRVEYTLTKKGQSLLLVFEVMEDCGNEYFPKPAHLMV